MSKAVEQSRQQLAELVGSHPDEIIFTSGGTEANNLAIRGTVAAIHGRNKVITSVIEHPATMEPFSLLENTGYNLVKLPVDEYGRVSPDPLSSLVDQETALVSIMHANSETGSLQPIRQLADIAHEAAALMHTDAAQSCGKIEIDVQKLDVDLLSIAGHKLYGPQGVGALYLRHGTRIQPVVLGAGHERGIRPGTENVAAIVGLGKACEIARLQLHTEGLRQARLRDRLWSKLRQGVPGLVLNGHPEQRLPNTLNVLFPRCSGNRLLVDCPGIAASTGSACHETGENASDIILAMGVPPEQAIGSVRLTLGRSTTTEQVDLAADHLIEAWGRQQ